MGVSEVNFLLERRLQQAGTGDANACYELGVAYSSGTNGVLADLVEAHKWFNLAAVWGDTRGHEARVEISDEMSAREIAEAQRQARAWLNHAGRKVA